jgi:hypothetical protein
MDLAQQFGAVKLKKAAVGTHDRSAPVVAGSPPLSELGWASSLCWFLHLLKIDEVIHVHPNNDAAGQEHDAAASVEQFKNKIHAVNLENWYPLLKVSYVHAKAWRVSDATDRPALTTDTHAHAACPGAQEHTFATEFLDLSMLEARVRM